MILLKGKQPTHGYKKAKTGGIYLAGNSPLPTASRHVLAQITRFWSDIGGSDMNALKNAISNDAVILLTEAALPMSKREYLHSLAHQNKTTSTLVTEMKPVGTSAWPGSVLFHYNLLESYTNLQGQRKWRRSRRSEVWSRRRSRWKITQLFISRVPL